MSTRKRSKSGVRFRTLTHELAAEKGVRDPKAVAAPIGRRKYGKRRFAQMSLAGRRKR